MRETSMNGHDEHSTLSSSRANDNVARLVAYFSPYLFWGTVAAIAAGLFLLG